MRAVFEGELSDVEKCKDVLSQQMGIALFVRGMCWGVLDMK